jgi:hypothetical protein
MVYHRAPSLVFYRTEVGLCGLEHRMVLIDMMAMVLKYLKIFPPILLV